MKYIAPELVRLLTAFADAAYNETEGCVSVDLATIEASSRPRRLTTLMNVYQITANDPRVNRDEVLLEIFRELDGVNPGRFVLPAKEGA